MSGRRNTAIWNTLGRLGLAARAAVLGAVVVVAFAAVAPVAHRIAPSDGVTAAAVAAAACWTGGVLALVVASLCRGPAAILYHALLGTLARAVPPLLLGLAAHFRAPSLIEAGVAFYLVVFYLVALTTETIMTLAQVPSGPNSSKVI